MPRSIQLTVNGRSRSVETDEERPLLDVLREDLKLTGAKYGCGEGACGACTVLIDGAPVQSCITTAADAEGHEITTIEGLADGERLHPVQQAFLDRQAMQCGYCVPGQILSAVALLRSKENPSREDIFDALDAHICRCCNYANILAAVEHAAEANRG